MFVFTIRVSVIRPKNCIRLLKRLEGPGSHAIGELCNNGRGWFKGELRLPNAVDGTSITAVTYNWAGKIQIRIYYQDENLSLMEHCHSGGGWYPGQLISPV